MLAEFGMIIATQLATYSAYIIQKKSCRKFI
jgi:hypothetical protein